MALKKSGVILIAENYNQYMNQMRSINKAHQQAFDTQPVNKWSAAASQMSVQLRNLKKAADDTWRTIQNLRKGLDDASSSASSFGKSTSGAGGILSRLKGGLGGAVGGLGNFASSITSMIPSVIKWLGLLKLASDALNFLKASGEVAKRNETLRVSLETLGKQYGYTVEQIDIATQQLTRQGITTQAAQQSLIRMARANLEWSKASDLARIAQSAAVVEGRNSSDMFNELIYGIQRLSPQILDNLGIQIKLGQAYEKYASQIGKSSKELSSFEQQQAVLNEVIEQGKPLLDVYGEALGTAGKKEGSLARKIEETQNNIGQLLLPLETLKVEMKDTFWTGAQEATKGLQGFLPFITMVTEGLKSIDGETNTLLKTMLSFSQFGNFFVGPGKQIFEFTKGVTKAFVVLVTVVQASMAAIIKDIQTTGEVFKKVGEGDIAGAMAAIEKRGDGLSVSITKIFQEELPKNLQKMAEDFPILTQSWEDLNKEIEYGEDALERYNQQQEEGIDNTEAQTEALEKQKAQLETQVEIYKKLEGIQRKFEEGLQKLKEDTAKGIKKINEELAKGEQKIREKTQKALQKLEQDGKKREEKLIQDFNKRKVEEQRKANQQLANEQRRFLLSQQQELRRFQLADRRLRAEGDVLGLMRLREDFELQQTESKENFGVQQDEAKQDIQEKSRIQQEEFQTRLKELRGDIEERRQEILNSQREELENLRANNVEKLAAFKESMNERYNALIEARNQEILELGRSLQDEQNVTKEGMEAIAAEIANVFGDQAAGDALIKGFTERTTTEFGRMVNELKSQLADLNADVQSTTNQVTSQAGKKAQDQLRKFRGGRSGSYPFNKSTNIGMREGGAGIVRGPATFNVEPGQREAVMFAPLPTMRKTLDVNMRGGFDIRGGQAAGREAVESALDTMVIEFERAVQRLSRR